jgi:hypothetical protein
MTNGSFDQLLRDPIFVVGAARSGTTWISDILAAHPLVARIHESWLFTPNNGIGSLFTEAHWPPGYSGLGHFLERNAALEYARELVVKVMAHALQPHHRYLVEKSPNHIYSVPLILEIFPNALFIHALRDGRDVCVSVRAAARSWIPSWKQSFGWSISKTAEAWRHETQTAQIYLREIPAQFIEVRYEDLHADPSENYRRIFDFCGIPHDTKLLQSIYQATDFKLNYTPDERHFRRGGRVGDWKQQFSVWDAFAFNRVAGDQLVALGYERNRFWLPQIFG